VVAPDPNGIGLRGECRLAGNVAVEIGGFEVWRRGTFLSVGGCGARCSLSFVVLGAFLF